MNVTIQYLRVTILLVGNRLVILVLSVVVALVSFHRNGLFIVFLIQQVGAIIKLKNDLLK